MERRKLESDLPDVEIKVEPPDQLMEHALSEQTFEVKEEIGVDLDVKLDPELLKQEREESDNEPNSGDNDTKKMPECFSDAGNGKTLIVRNIEAGINVEHIMKIFEKFGQLKHVVLSKGLQKETPSKNTGFILYEKKADADYCLKEYTKEKSDFKLHNCKFIVSMALSTNEIEAKLGDAIKSDPLGKRNLHLLLEGNIRSGSKASIGVSSTDMDMRAMILAIKWEHLESVNTFISDISLTIYNLSPSMNDGELRKLMLIHGGPGGAITQAEIIKDEVEKNRGQIRHGLVKFTKHDHALNALRQINNNSGIFTINQRPIVGFGVNLRRKLASYKEN